MKKYRLKQWYPSLPTGVNIGHIVTFDGKANSSKEGAIELYLLQEEPKIWITQRELHPRFWELIEEEKPKPLFTTYDGVEIIHIDQPLWGVSGFKKVITRASRVKFGDKVFAHEKNADEYIWRNKPLFSYEDFMKWGNVPYERVIKQLAMERIEQ